jgi:BirA family biotin operon repressor/biotin-[acetyl-CoA-carboxylase] ligase
VSGRPFPARLERFGSIPTTQSIVRTWLEEGQPEVAVAVADEQTAGRGRHGRGWTAPPGAALLLSCGFRPQGLPLRQGWRLAATVAMAMLEAAERIAALPPGRLALKWPNDLVAMSADGSPRKLAGVLGETVAAGDLVASAVVGIGINVDWPADRFPAGLVATMTSLGELTGGKALAREELLEAFLERLEPGYARLRAGDFDAAGWAARQCTTGARLEVELGGDTVVGTGAGLDPDGGELLLETPAGVLAIDSGEVVHCRLLASA